MEKILNTYCNDLTMEQAVSIFQRPKPKNRSWPKYYVYLVEVSHAAGGFPKLVLQSIIKYASAKLRPTLMAKANMRTTDWLLEAESLANFAQSMTLGERPAHTLGRSINAVDVNSALPVEVTCNYCKSEDSGKEKNWTLFVTDAYPGPSKSSQTGSATCVMESSRPTM
jgi:hypothetical protein